MEEYHRISVEKLNEEIAENKQEAALKSLQKESAVKDLKKKVQLHSSNCSLFELNGIANGESPSNKLNQVRQDQDERTRELAEAQEFQAKLMRVMGTMKQVQASPNHGSPLMLNEKYYPDLQDAEISLTPRELEKDPVHSLESSPTSHAGSAPKRTKTQRGFNSVSMYTERAAEIDSMGKRRSNNASEKWKRHPLKVRYLNTQDPEFWSPTQIQPQKTLGQNANTMRGANKENAIDYLEEDPGEKSFGSDVFTSTDYQHLNGSGGQVSKDKFDDTTLDL